MPEGAPKKRSSALEAAVFGVSLLAAHPEAKALEMPPNEPWHIGIQDRVRQAAVRDKTEAFSIYGRFNDGSGVWIPPVGGTISAVDMNPYDDIGALVGQRRNREFAAFCYLHTHVREFFRGHYGSKADRAFNPPSPQDIAGHAPGMLKYHTSLKLDPNIAHFVAADGKGLWYFSAGNMKNNTIESPRVNPHSINDSVSGKALLREAINFTTNSMQDGFSFKTEYLKLRQAYKTHMSADVRFVSYENVVNEPACAGVNYRP